MKSNLVIDTTTQWKVHEKKYMSSDMSNDRDGDDDINIRMFKWMMDISGTGKLNIWKAVFHS